MKIKVSETNHIRKEIWTAEGRELAFDVEHYHLSEEQKGQIEKAACTFLNSAVEILEGTVIP